MEAGSGGSARGKARPRDSRFLRCQGRACRSRSRSAGYWLTVAAVSVVLLVGHAGMASGRRMWSQITTPGEEMEKRRPGRQASLRTSAAERPSPTVLRGGRNAAHSSTYEYVDNFGCRGGSSSEEDEITDVKGCEQMCSEQPSCFAFTFNVETSRCYIKTNCTVKRKYTNFSGLKLLPTPAPTTGAPTEAPTPAPTRPPVDYAPAPAPTPRSPRDYNVLYGVRCDETVIDSAESRSADECKERCEALDQCNAYSFEVGSGRCYVMGHCDSWEYYPGSISGVVAYYDRQSKGVGELSCPESNEACEAKAGVYCPTWNETVGEMPDPGPGSFSSPYQDILDGDRTFITTYPGVADYPTCPFQPPAGPLPENWADACVENMKRVGFLDEIKGRPNEECPAGWFLCKGLCYTLVQRNSRGPEVGPSYYAPDYMSIEARCGLCGGARVAFVGDDPEMQKVAAEAAYQTINEDKAIWVRRYRFLENPNPLVESASDPYQPWHRYVTMFEHDKVLATYQRYYTGEKDRLRTPQWDIRYRNQEGSVLCVNTISRIKAAERTVNGGVTFHGGCIGEGRHNLWDNHRHRWFPEHDWPFPGH